jgi:hypothetical protein
MQCNTSDWKPRWYYVMQNKTSGMLYVGQTVRLNMDKYKGSGRYWEPHCRKHGGYDRKNIEVFEQSWFDNEDDATLWLKMLQEDCGEYWASDRYANICAEATSNSPLKTPEIHYKSSSTNRKNQTGAFNLNHKKNKTGIWSPEVRKEALKNALETNKRNQTSVYNPLIQSLGGKLGSKVTNSQLWKCADCSLTTGSGPLGNHQKAFGHIGKTKVN